MTQQQEKRFRIRRMDAELLADLNKTLKSLTARTNRWWFRNDHPMHPTIAAALAPWMPPQQRPAGQPTMRCH